jgi:putative FmdB family regulatory protein
MPLYSYRCENSHEFTELRGMSARKDPAPCPECGENGTLFVTPVAFDALHMGCDPGMPTFYDKWAKMQREKNSGKTSDSNNDRYRRQAISEKTGVDV